MVFLRFIIQNPAKSEICKRVYLKGCLHWYGTFLHFIVHCLPDRTCILNIQIDQMTLNIQPAASHQTALYDASKVITLSLKVSEKMRNTYHSLFFLAHIWGWGTNTSSLLPLTLNTKRATKDFFVSNAHKTCHRFGKDTNTHRDSRGEFQSIL